MGLFIGGLKSAENKPVDWAPIRKIVSQYETQGLEMDNPFGRVIKVNNEKMLEADRKTIEESLKSPMSLVIQGYSGFGDSEVYMSNVNRGLGNIDPEQNKDLILKGDGQDEYRSKRIDQILESIVASKIQANVSEGADDKKNMTDAEIGKLRNGLKNLLQNFGLKTTMNIVASIKI